MEDNYDMYVQAAMDTVNKYNTWATIGIIVSIIILIISVVAIIKKKSKALSIVGIIIGAGLLIFSAGIKAQITDELHDMGYTQDNSY